MKSWTSIFSAFVLFLSTVAHAEPLTEDIAAVNAATSAAMAASKTDSEGHTTDVTSSFLQKAEALEYEVQGAVFVTHIYFVGNVPPEYGWYVYEAAKKEGVDPLDLAAVLISENSGPDKDFSIQGALHRPYKLDYETTAEGKAGERGLFQVIPYWGKKAGFPEEDLFDPQVNAEVAAFVVATNKQSHIKCKQRKYNYHTWIAHYKCARVDRDSLEGFCRFKQNKWWRLRASLDAVLSPDFAGIAEAQQETLDKVQRRAQRDKLRAHKKAAEAIEKSATQNADIDAAEVNFDFDL